MSLENAPCIRESEFCQGVLIFALFLLLLPVKITTWAQTGGITTTNILPDLYKEIENSIVKVKVISNDSSLTAPLASNITTGFLYDKNGTMLPVPHGRTPMDNIEVSLPDGLSHKASLIGTDPFLDLAILNVQNRPKEKLLPLELVTDVSNASPAQKTGIRGGSPLINIAGQGIDIGRDVILRIEENTVRKIDDVLACLAREKRVGDTAQLTVHSNGETENINVTLASRPTALESRIQQSQQQFQEPLLQHMDHTLPLLYTNPGDNVQMRYPSNWTTEETNLKPNQVAWLWPDEFEGEDIKPVAVIMSVGPGQSFANIDEYMQYSSSIYQHSFDPRVINESRSILSGMPAYQVTYYDYDSNDNKYKSLVVSTYFQGEDFVVKYYAEPGYYNKYLPTVKKMIDSFRITKSSNDTSIPHQEQLLR